MKRLPWITLLIAASAVGIWFLPTVAEDLQFDRVPFASGQWWRALTGHLTHWTFDHLAWDVATFVCLGSIIEARSRRLLAWTLLASAVTISGAVWSFAPYLASYRGLSGIDSALFASVTCLLLRGACHRRSSRAILPSGFLLLAFVLKSAFEVFLGSSVFVEPGDAFLPVPLAHLVGAAVGAGVVAFAGTARLRRRATAAEHPAPA